MLNGCQKQNDVDVLIQEKRMTGEEEVAYIIRTLEIDDMIDFYTIPILACSYLKVGFSVGSRSGAQSMMMS